jgi:RNA polymerase-associated protein
MDFEIRDVDLYNKPEDINVMNPYGQVPILVERDLILYESNIINEYIDERFPHPQLMPGDPVDRARVRLFLSQSDSTRISAVSPLTTFHLIIAGSAPKICGIQVVMINQLYH